MIVKLYSVIPSPIPLLPLIPRILGSLNVKLEGTELSTHLLIILYIHMLQLCLLHHDLIHAPLGFSCNPLGEGSFYSSRASHKGTGSTISSPCPRFLSTCVCFSTLGMGKPSQYHGGFDEARCLKHLFLKREGSSHVQRHCCTTPVIFLTIVGLQYRM